MTATTTPVPVTHGVPRAPGLSLRWKLALSYAAFLAAAGVVLLGVLLLVLGYLPDENLVVVSDGGFAPNRTDLLEAAVPFAVAGVGFLGLVGLGGGWLLAGRVLRPLDRIGQAARLAAQGSLDHRIHLPGPDDELRRLADDFDRMLQRLQSSFEEQRRFTANASHQLRTPQAVIRTILQVTRSDPDGRDIDTALARLEETNDRAIDILDSLLLLAHADRAALRSEHCDLGALVTRAMSVVPVPAGIQVTVHAGSDRSTSITGDRRLLEQMVGNLVHNAVLHNAPGGWVTVDVAVAEGDPLVRVENTGAVLPPSLVATLTEPFVRGSGRIRTGRAASGSGLGLSIAASIAEAHDARLTLAARPEGGLIVSVRFLGQVAVSRSSGPARPSMNRHSDILSQAGPDG